LRIQFWTILYWGKGTWRDGSSPGKCKCSPDVIDAVVNLKNSLGRGPLVVTLIASQSGNSLKQNLNNERIAACLIWCQNRINIITIITIISVGGSWLNVRIKSRQDIHNNKFENINLNLRTALRTSTASASSWIAAAITFLSRNLSGTKRSLKTNYFNYFQFILC
jgi:hypothetical protein